MSIANWYFKIGNLRILMDGYITRVPGPPFFFAPAGFPNDQFAFTVGPFNVDVESVTAVKKRARNGRQTGLHPCRTQSPRSHLGYTDMVQAHRRADHRRTVDVLPGGDRARQRRDDPRRALQPQRQRVEPDPALRARALRATSSRSSDR